MQTLWYVVVDVGLRDDGRRKQKWHGGFRTRREAEQELTRIVGSLETQSYVPPQRVTLADFTHNDWLPLMRSQVKGSTWDSYSRNLELHVLPVLGARPLQAMTAGHLNALYQSLLNDGRRNGTGGLSPKTVRYIHTTMSKLLADAVDQGVLTRNVATTAKPPKAGKGGANHLQFWTPEQLNVFLDFVRDDRLYALWHLATMTGMRRGELLGLRWADLDLDSARLSVRQTLISVAYEVSISTPKNHRARVIDLDPETVEVLRRHTGSSSSCEVAAGARSRFKDLVFTRPDGDVIHPDRLTQIFDLLVKRSRLPRIRLHDTRHTHATIGLRAGVPVKVMSERLGHATPAFTLQQYAHVIPGMQAEAAAAIANLVRRRPASVDTPPQLDNDDGEPVDAEADDGEGGGP